MGAADLAAAASSAAFASAHSRRSTHALHTRFPFFLSCAPLKSDSGRSAQQSQQRLRVGDSSSTVTEEPPAVVAGEGMLAMTAAL